MMEASAQLLLENSVPKSSSANSMSNRNSSENGSNFSQYLSNSKMEINDKKPSSENKPTASRENTRTAKTAGEKEPTRSEKQPVKESDAVDSSETVSQKPVQAKKTAEENVSDDAEPRIVEAEVDHQQLKHASELITKNNVFLNPELLLKQSAKTEDSVQENDSVLESPIENSLQNLVRKILQEVTPKSDEKTKTEDVDSELNALAAKLGATKPVQKESTQNIPFNMAQANVQNLSEKPATPENQAVDADDVNVANQQAQAVSALLAKLLSSQSSKTDTDSKKEARIQALEGIKNVSASENDLENIVEMLNQEGSSLEGLLKNESLLNKILERLDLDKNKGDLLFQARMANEKTSNLSDFVSQLSQKVAGESVDKASFLNPLNPINKPASVLPQQQFVLATPINQPAWGAEFNKRIQFMIKSDIQHAELRLDPPELGRIHVKINLNQDQANVSFTSAHNSVRDAIEQTLPRLRELLSESGLQLGQTDVASQFQQQKDNGAGDENHLSPPVYASMEEETAVESAETHAKEYALDGVIDYFA